MYPCNTAGAHSKEACGRPPLQASRTALEDPCGPKLPDVLRVDLLQRAVTLPVIGTVVGEPVVRLRAGPENALVGNAPGNRRRHPPRLGETHLVDGVPRVYVVCRFCHLLLLSAVVAGPGGR